MTPYLLERAERVIAIEVDPVMIGHLRRKFGEEPRLEIVSANVLEVDLAQWGPCRLAGNLPYYITSPILERVFRASQAIERAVVLIQKEVALRLTAAEGSRDYGYLSIATQVHATPRLLFPVPPAAFHPPPRVDSAVVELILKPGEADDTGFLEFAGVAFQHKRKTTPQQSGAQVWGGHPEAP